MTKYLPTLQPVTQHNYKKIIENELLPELGKYQVGNISKAQIMSLLDKKAYVDESPVMADRVRSRLSRIFSFGIERGIVENNPVQNISKYRKTKAGGKVENKKNRYYKEDEIRELWHFF